MITQQNQIIFPDFQQHLLYNTANQNTYLYPYINVLKTFSTLFLSESIIYFIIFCALISLRLYLLLNL